ncbi:MAG: hypothetical protein K2W82_13405 [Candidatus Obscuribacterales bacterium]|nr:hypothetical protein [Candidatus Obscuribacterales bacterium]
MSLCIFVLLELDMSFTKQLTFILATTFFLSSFTTSEAAKSRSRRPASSGAKSGGVFLSTPNPTNPLEHNNRGVELGQKQLWPDAVREHELAVEGDPFNTQFRTNLSCAHMEYAKWLSARGKYYDACTQYRQAMYVDPANAQADMELDNVLRKLKKDPTDYNVRKNMAIDADVNQQYETAIVEWRKCVKMKDDPLSHAELGRVLLKSGKDVDGYEQLRIAVGRVDWPTDQKIELAACHRQLADMLKDYAYKARKRGKGTLGMKRLANAGIEYRRAVTLNPADAQAIKGFLEVAREAVAIRPSFDNHLMLGAAYLLAADFPHAQMEYLQCYKLDPKRPELATARIAYHQSVARSPLASDELVADSVAKVKGLVDQDPENARLWYILGRLREHQASYELAKKSYDKAISINPLIDADLKQAMVRIGAAPPESAATAAASADGKPAATGTTKTPEQAKAALQEVLKEKAYQEVENAIEKGDSETAISKGTALFQADSKDGRIARLVGLAQEKKGSLDDAKAWYRIAAGLGDKLGQDALEQMDSSRVQPKLAEADGLADKGDFVKAASTLREALDIAPRRSDIHRKLGDILNKLGDKEGAKKEMDQADKLDKAPAGNSDKS